jgi:uncharacterized protein (TIGR00251 family)
MKISVKVKPGAKKESLEKVDEGHYIVSVKEPPTEGRANYAVTRAIAEYLNIGISRVNIASGHSSRNKIIEIL